MNLAPRTPAPRSDYAASHDAHMRSTYGDPWDVQPTDDPASGDPLTGTYGRTYAESGALLMQATGDMFGPVTGYAPILLFAITNVDQAPILHASTGGARLTHVNTFDTWDAALRGLRTHVRPITLDTTPSVFHPGRSADPTDSACSLGCTDEDCAVTGVCDECEGGCARITAGGAIADEQIGNGVDW